MPRSSELLYPPAQVRLGGPVRTAELASFAHPPGPLVTPDGYAVVATSKGLKVLTPDGDLVTHELSTTPALVATAPGAAVLVSFGGGLSALAVPDLDVLWLSDDGGGISPAPAFHRGVVYSYLDGEVTAVSANGGELGWRTPLPLTGPNYEVAISAGEDVVVVGNGGAVHGLDPSSGEMRWTVRIEELERADDGTAPGTSFGVPTAGGGQVIVATDTTLLTLNGARGEMLWHVGVPDPPRYGVLVGAVDFVYHSDGAISGPIPPDHQTELVARRLATGEETWQQTLTGWALTSAPTNAGQAIVSVGVVPTGQELIYDTALDKFGWDGARLDQRQLSGSGSWQVGAAGGFVAIASEIITDPSEVGTWELSVIDP